MLLCIYINDEDWSASEREEIINQSIEIYMEKRLKTRVAAAEEAPRNERKYQENENEQIVDSGDDKRMKEDDLILEGLSNGDLSAEDDSLGIDNNSGNEI